MTLKRDISMFSVHTTVVMFSWGNAGDRAPLSLSRFTVFVSLLRGGIPINLEAL